MSFHLSNPIDDLIQQAVDRNSEAGRRAESPLLIHSTDVLIIGSGYGASVAAARLAGLESARGRRIGVTVLERGREYAVGEFPNGLGDLPGFVRIQRPGEPHPIGNPDGLFDVRIGEDLDVLVGNGLGGGSLINANVAARPDPSVFGAAWPAAYREGGLDAAFDELERALGARPVGEDLPKSKAFERLGRELGFAVKRPPITVTRGEPGSATRNAQGIDQPHCTNCGNCITGCNVGAKNTLAMNLIPEARSRGARFYTGANVLSVLPSCGIDERRWRVEVQRTQSIRTPLEGERFLIEARFVILAAGAIGSTEILLRSKARAGGLSLSPAVGSRFSTNGDGLAFTFGERTPVHAMGRSDVQRAASQPGPTITRFVQGMLETDAGDRRPFTLEDGTIPAAMVKVFGEVLTTAAQLNRLADNRLPAYFEGKARDPLAFDRGILDHGQVFLAMNDDGAQRRLVLTEAKGEGDDGDLAHLHAVSASLERPARLDRLDEPETSPPARRADAGLRILDQRFMRENLGAALDGGQYVANPLWRLLPEGASEALGGRLPEPRQISVHPLGGCPMGEDATTGAVNPEGVVFRADGGLHEGLLVLDGSILPSAVATNPFLTISAVAWKACEALIEGGLRRDGWQRVALPNGGQRLAATSLATSRAAVATPRPSALRSAGRPDAEDERSPRAKLVLREQMIGCLSLASASAADREALASLGDFGTRLAQTDGMILRLCLEPFDPLADFGSLARGRVRLPGVAHLYCNPLAAEDCERERPYGAPAALGPSHCIAAGELELAILEPDPPGRIERILRTARALAAYLRRRGISGVVSGGGGGNLLSAARKAARFLAIARMHANHRQFRYAVRIETPDGTRIAFEAKKELRWQPGHPRIWDALLALPVERVVIEPAQGRPIVLPAHLRVDASYMLDEGLIQAEGAHDMVESAVAALGFVAYFARCMFETSFWEFGAPEYPKAQSKNPGAAAPNFDPQPLEIGLGQRIEPVVLPFRVPLGSADPAARLDLQLLHYEQPSRPVAAAKRPEPVLLIHGLAQGSGIYTSPHVPDNMASWFWREGYDVWVVDYRLSNRFSPQSMRYGQWGLDEIGEFDVTHAIELVFEKSGGQSVKIFAHCIGAVGVEMAILRSGSTGPDGVEAKIESVVFNAIHPWIVPAPANLARSKLGAFARAWFPEALLNPILQREDEVSGGQTLMDRLAFSFARMSEDQPKGDLGHGPGRYVCDGICDRMTFLYGRMWRHENLAESVHENFAELVGPAPLSIYQQLYSLTRRERILDDEGRNTYLLAGNVIRRWSKIPTLFVHGELSDVFNPQSATRAAVRLERIFRREQARPFSRFVPPPVDFVRFEGMGHMDPILGKQAKDVVFARIRDFFVRAKAWHEAPISPPRDEKLDARFDTAWRGHVGVEVGPIVRAAWIDREAGQIVRRSWRELDRFGEADSAPTSGTDAGRQSLEPPFEGRPFPVEVADLDPAFRWLDDRLAPFSLDTASPIPPASLRAVPDQGSHGVIGRSQTAWGVAASSSVTDGAAGIPPGWFRRLSARLANTSAAEDSFRFLVGSCRYPGTPVEAHLSDRIFGAMRSRIRSVDVDLGFFVGDQIYADAYNDLFEDGNWRERYVEGYRAAFGSPHAARLFASLPVHFAIDDHEIVDNWSGHRAGNSVPRRRTEPRGATAIGLEQRQFKAALDTAHAYIGAARAGDAGVTDARARTRLWYRLEHGPEVPFPCFVLDTRTERELRNIERYGGGRLRPRLFGQDQLDAFKLWLVEVASDPRWANRPKFVFAGQMLAPVWRELAHHPSLFRTEDGFLGYPETLGEILRHIALHQVRHLVFVGGDLHLSCAARLAIRMQGQPDVVAWQIVASGLYSPMPFANSSLDDYDWSKPLEVRVASPGPPLSLESTAYPITTSRSHFLECSVGTDPGSGEWQIDLMAVGADGKPIEPVERFNEAGDQLRVRCEGVLDAIPDEGVSLLESEAKNRWLERTLG